MKSFFERIKVEKDNDKYLCYRIKYNLISDEELRKNINSYDWKIRCYIAKKRKCLDILVYDEYWFVRCVVAKQGYGLDILVKDEDLDVKCTVARQGYGLEILKDDVYWRVRKEVEIQLKIQGLL